MKLLGAIVLVLGIFIAFVAMNTETDTITMIPVVGTVVRTPNAQLMSQKNSTFILSGFLAIIGVILLAVDSRNKAIIEAAHPTDNNKEMSAQEKQDTYKGYKILLYIALAAIALIFIVNLMK